MKRRITSIMLTLCLALSLLPVNAWAAEENPGGDGGGGLTWTYDEDTDTLTICGEGPMGTAPDEVADIKEKVKHVVIEEGVTTVGESAFSGWPFLESVELPRSLTELDGSAFSGWVKIIYNGPQWKWQANNLPSLSFPMEYLPGGTCGDWVVWSYDPDTKIVTVERAPGAEDNAECSINSLPWESEWRVDSDYAVFINSGDGVMRGVPNIVDNSRKVLHFFGRFEYWGMCVRHMVVQEYGQEPTCSNGRTQGFMCMEPDCHALSAMEPKSIPAIIGEHTWGEWVTTKEPTETEVGTKTRTCSVCSKEEAETIPAGTGGSGSDDPEKPVGYEITFDGNGGIFGKENKRRTQRTGADGKLKEKPEEPAWSGHTFDGWFTSAEGGSKLNLDPNSGYQFRADTTIYAQWTKNPNGNDPGGDDPFTPIGPFTITFNANGGSGGTTMKTGTNGKLSALPRDPVRNGYTFDGWYFDAPDDHLKIYTSTVFRANTTVYAHWTQNSSGSTNPSNPSNPSIPSNPTTPSNPSTPSGGSYQISTPGSVYGGSYYVSHTSAPAGTVVTIQVTPWSNYTLGQLSVIRTDTNQIVYVTRYGSQYTFTMPNSDVRLTITYSPSYSGGYVPSQPATATRYVNWYYSGGNTYHVSSGLVPTGSALTRDMFISILYNLDGSGSGDRDPTIWAATNNIVPDVVMSELWGADKSITREQAAMILYCYAQYKGYSTSQTTSLSGYRDAGQIRSMAVPAMAWCRATGLMAGTSATTLSPLGTLTCGQANVIISRFLSGVAR